MFGPYLAFAATPGGLGGGSGQQAARRRARCRGRLLGLVRQGREHVARLDLEERQLGVLDQIGATVVVLPHLLDPGEAGSVPELAQELVDQADL